MILRRSRKAVVVFVLLAVTALPVGNAAAESLAELKPLSPATPRTSWEGLAIVVNRDNPISDVSLPQLRAMFFGERKWWTPRRRVVVASMKRGTPERQTMTRVVYKMDDHQLEHYFLYQEFKGEPAASHKTLRTPADLKKFVVTTPGAVGYLRESDVDGSVKVIRINGLLPGDDGYPLRLRRKVR
jgi:ABC-type phosphate transport system substrate-binding protein